METVLVYRSCATEIEMKENITSLTETLLGLMVRNPHDVQVETNVLQSAVEITIAVNASDTPKVIGRKGATFRAIRSILTEICRKHGKHAYVHPLRDGELNHSAYDPFVSRAEWPRDEVNAAIFFLVGELALPQARIGVKIKDDGEKTMIDIKVPQLSFKYLLETNLVESIRTILNAICGRQGRIGIIDIGGT